MTGPSIARNKIIGEKTVRVRPQAPRSHSGTSLQEALEREASRIAQALHDEAGQMLAAVHLRLDQALLDLPVSHSLILQEIKSMLSSIEDELRRLSHELRPSILDHLGLIPALKFLTDGVAKRSGLLITIENATEGRFPAAIETAVYRVVQEALTNTGKHARARTVRIRLWGTRRIHCVIQDDGIGISGDPAHTAAQTGDYGLGLSGMRERIEHLKGTFGITSAPGRGTTVSATIPLNRTVSGTRILRPISVSVRVSRLAQTVAVSAP